MRCQFSQEGQPGFLPVSPLQVLPSGQMNTDRTLAPVWLNLSQAPSPGTEGVCLGTSVVPSRSSCDMPVVHQAQNFRACVRVMKPTLAYQDSANVAVLSLSVIKP